jgi:glycerophosphoryl diester phosphodiesterase
MIHPIRIAHRGASGQGLAPENTLAAFEKAIQLGVDAVEIDVHATADSQIVVLHDAALDRTTDQSGPVHQKSLVEVKKADAGSWFSPAYAGEPVPLLEEVLDLARHRALVLVEIKADFIAEKVLKVVADMDAEDQVVVQSFNPETVRRTKLIAPAVPAALLVGKLPTTPSRMRARRMVRQVLELRANALAIWHATLTPPFFEEMRRRAVGVWTWTVDEDIIMRDMALMGVQGIITNYPDRLNRVLEELEEEGGIQPPLGRRRRLKRSRWGRRRRLRKVSASRRSV